MLYGAQTLEARTSDGGDGAGRRAGVHAERTGVVIKPDPERVFFRPFHPGAERATKIIARVMSLTEEQTLQELTEVRRLFSGRHAQLSSYFLKRFEENRQYMLTDQPISLNRQLLIGAYFSQEYALESAALFNPSMVWHPDQSGLPPGARRFILSLRAVGEGHVSSIVFRSGVIDRQYRITLDPVSRYAAAPETRPDPAYDRELFYRKLMELGFVGPFIDRVMANLGESFTYSQLAEQVRTLLRTEKLLGKDYEREARGALSLAESNYEIRFSENQELSERIIFPSTSAEERGIEDARFVQFAEDGGGRTYYAIYTAYDGRTVIPQMLETRDFLSFKISTLNGPAVQNKGMALFPRKIKGCYAVLSRQDNENIYLMFSDNPHFWYAKELLVRPTYPWEFVQLGNCGSPVETERGWLVLSHGVGPMRQYSIGALLLDRHDPRKVLGRLPEPLLTPQENERAGYVPNVVYSCGAQIFQRKLIIPYAMADYATSFATVDLEALLALLLRSGR